VVKFSFNPFDEFSNRTPGNTKPQLLDGQLVRLHELGRWAWNLGRWENLDSFEMCFKVKNMFVDYCVSKQSGAWFGGNRDEPIPRQHIREIDWMDDGVRRDLFNQFWENVLLPKVTDGADGVNSELGLALMRLKTLHPSRLYWALTIESVEKAYVSFKSNDSSNLILHSVQAGEALRQGLAHVQSLEGMLELSNIASKNAKKVVSCRSDQQQKAGWIEHCENAKKSGINILRLDDLFNIPGYDPLVTKISARTLKKWAKEIGIELKAGRPKK
jgi:hypothetical protein